MGKNVKNLKEFVECVEFGGWERIWRIKLSDTPFAQGAGGFLVVVEVEEEAEVQVEIGVECQTVKENTERLVNAVVIKNPVFAL